MRHSLSLASFALAASLLSTGCAGAFKLHSVTTSAPPNALFASCHVAAVQIDVSPELQDDKQALLDQNNVLGAMQGVLTGLGGGPNPLTLFVSITQMRVGYGPARIHTESRLVDANGQVVRSFENESVSMKGGSRTARLQRIVQDNVQKIADSI